MTAATAKKILLVDDDEALCLSLGEQLRLHEFTTVETGTGVEALNLAKREYFDAILLDIGLPDMNGCEVCRLMRSRGVKLPRTVAPVAVVHKFGHDPVVCMGKRYPLALIEPLGH